MLAMTVAEWCGDGGSEPDIPRPGCPVASTLAIGSLGSGKTNI